MWKSIIEIIEEEMEYQDDDEYHHHHPHHHHPNFNNNYRNGNNGNTKNNNQGGSGGGGDGKGNNRFQNNNKNNVNNYNQDASIGAFKPEDHDLPFLNADSVDYVTDYEMNELINSELEEDDDESERERDGYDDDEEEEGESEGYEDVVEHENDNNRKSRYPNSNNTKKTNNTKQRHRQQRQQQQQQQKQKKKQFESNYFKYKPSSTTSNLALRLHASGLPIKSSSSSSSQETKNVQSILKSLTKTEGHLLSNTLLSPIDLQYDNGSINTTTTTQKMKNKKSSSSKSRSGGLNDNIGTRKYYNDNDNDNNDTKKKDQIVQMWDDIGGLDDVKEGLLDLAFPLIMMFQQSEEERHLYDDDDNHENKYDNIDVEEEEEEEEENDSFNYYGGLLSNPPGVLLYGPPGTGKTMLVRALANTVNARFLCVTPSTLLRKYVGETNINVRALFTLASKISPCIIFIDEMEGLFRERSGSGSGGGGDEHEVNRELKTEFMQLWDGVQGSASNNNVLVIGATNRPFDVDSAFLRRMPRSFLVGLPDYSSRVSILNKMLVHVPLEEGFDIEGIARVTEGYTPSDIKEVLRTSALTPLREARIKVMEEQIKVVKDGKQPPPIDKMPVLRPLQTLDVMQAQLKVSPTQLTSNYRSALLEFASKATGGRVGSVVAGTPQNIPASQWHYNPNEQTSNAQTQGNDGFFYTNIDQTEGGDGGSYIHDEDDYDSDASTSYYDE